MAKKSSSIQVVASDFTRAMRDLSRITGVSFQDIIRAETKSILEAATKKTVSAQVKLIEQRVRGRVARTYPARSGKTYLMEGSAHAPRGWRLPDAVWSGIQTQIKNGIKRRKDARGLSKKSWLQAAKSLGLDISVPGYVAKSTTPKGDYPQNATASEKTDGRGFFIQVTNERTYSPSVLDAIRAAMRGRTNFFKKNLRLGVFKKTSEIAARYPGLKVA
jgi:hypothetical protein